MTVGSNTALTTINSTHSVYAMIVETQFNISVGVPERSNMLGELSMRKVAGSSPNGVIYFHLEFFSPIRSQKLGECHTYKTKHAIHRE